MESLLGLFMDGSETLIKTEFIVCSVMRFSPVWRALDVLMNGYLFCPRSDAGS